MIDRVEVRMSRAACDRFRRRLADIEGWEDGAVKFVAQQAVRAELSRIGQQMLELEWRWIR